MDDIDTIRRLASWGDWSTWTGRQLANGMPFETGPVAELELGTRVMGWILSPQRWWNVPTVSAALVSR